ncbi:unnamed protein product [Sphagnum jensenii]|uniref:Uncharacterized protein n=1 Tax=Sphagnum jensenii TaxID=128206 RepID=A0ABP1ALB6_9BRYO
MATKKKPTSFQKSHTLKFDVEIVLMDARGDMTIRCKFCLHEGRDIVEVGVASRKHKQCSDIKYFTKPFAPFKYHNHHESQHASSWSEYQDLLIKQKN